MSGDLVPRGQLDLDAVENEEPMTALVRRLEREGHIDEVSLRRSGLGDLTIAGAEALLRFFAGLHRGSAWWVGDLHAYAEDRWHAEASQLANATGLSPDTITRYTTMAQKFLPHERVAGLGISHHRLVIKLDAGTRRAWLGRALAGDSPNEGQWTVERLREELQLAGLVRIRNPEPAETSPVNEPASETGGDTPSPASQRASEIIEPSSAQTLIGRSSLREIAAEIVAMSRDEHGRVVLDRNVLERLRAALSEETS